MWKLGGNEQRHLLITSTLWWLLPLHGPRLLIYRVRTPAHIAAGHHIWWSFPYPPHGDAVGSLQLGPNRLETAESKRFTKQTPLTASNSTIFSANQFYLLFFFCYVFCVRLLENISNMQCNWLQPRRQRQFHTARMHSVDKWSACVTLARRFCAWLKCVHSNTSQCSDATFIDNLINTHTHTHTV